MAWSTLTKQWKLDKNSQFGFILVSQQNVSKQKPSVDITFKSLWKFHRFKGASYTKTWLFSHFALAKWQNKCMKEQLTIKFRVKMRGKKEKTKICMLIFIMMNIYKLAASRYFFVLIFHLFHSYNGPVK